MTPLKLNLAILRYPYGGTGSTSSEVPDIADWLIETIIQMREDPRIGHISQWRKSDTPIPMVRNESILHAKAAGADLALMIDSDMAPDVELLHGDPFARPFWKTSFDFLYGRYLKGLMTIVGAPYCGPPPYENVYMFRYANYQNDSPDVDLRIEQYCREEAAVRSGFEEVAALPTGLILYDLRVFDLVPHPWFYYEYEGDGVKCQHCQQRKPGPQAKKASTEDVTATRDFVLHAHMELGYNPVFCNWDAWAGHWKPKCVRKPQVITVDYVGEKFVRAAKSGRPANQRFMPHFQAKARPPAVNGHAASKDAKQALSAADVQAAKDAGVVFFEPDPDEVASGGLKAQD